MTLASPMYRNLGTHHKEHAAMAMGSSRTVPDGQVACEHAQIFSFCYMPPKNICILAGVNQKQEIDLCLLAN